MKSIVLWLSALSVLTVCGDSLAQTRHKSTRQAELQVERLLQKIKNLEKQLANAHAELANLTGKVNLDERGAEIPKEEFQYLDVKYSESNIGIRIVGRIKNNSTATHSLATFNAEIYDGETMIDVAPIIIPKLGAGETRAFSTLARAQHKSDLRIVIQFENGIQDFVGEGMLRGGPMRGGR